MKATRQEIDKFLWDNVRNLVAPEYYFGVDNNGAKEEDFDKAELRVLVSFLSTGKTRAVSNTFNALNHLVRKNLGDKVFIDYCYFPEDANKELLEKNNIPYLFGNVSHAPASDYDVILMSHSIMPEVFNIPHVLHNSGIPLTFEERVEDGRFPLILYGGAAANESSITLGPIKKDGKVIGHSLVDICQYGYGEFMLEDLMAFMHEFKMGGKDLRKDKKDFIEAIIGHEIFHDYIFLPGYYRWNYDGFRITSIEKLDPRLPDRVKYNKITRNDFDGFPLKVFNLDGESSTGHDVMISSGCSGQNATCSFCMEGTVSGVYRERSLPDIVKTMEEVRRTSAPNSLSYYSYNVNYYNYFKDLIMETARRFSSLSLLNERLDVVAYADEQLALAKRVGLKRFSGAVEGMGERIRNNILNKNLPRETLMMAVRNVFRLKLMHMKWGLIMTGQETDADIDEFIDEVDEVLRIRAEEGANTSLQINVTPLVLYSQIPLRYLPRVTAKLSYTQERTMHRLISAMQERKIRIKFNGRGPGTYIEQLILDFGPLGTDWLVDVTLNEGLVYSRHFNNADKDRVTTCLDRQGLDHLFFIEERDNDWIFPNDHIIYAPDKLIEDWKRRHTEMDFSAPICLQTLATKNPKCASCGVCSPQEAVKMVRRDLSDQHSLEEVIDSLSENRYVDSTRVVVKVNPKWFFVSKVTLAHYITSQFLRRDESLAEAFYAVGKNTTSWVSNHGQADWYGGTFAFDIKWKENVRRDRLENLIEEVNKSLDSCQIQSISPHMKELEITIKGDVAYMGEIDNLSMSFLTDRLMNFDWNIKVAAKSMGGQLDTENRYMPELKDRILFTQSKGKVLCYMSLPMNISPYLLLSSITGRGYDRILPIARFNVVDHGMELDANCQCGKHLTYSMFKDQSYKLCQTCLGKILLSKLVQ